jgi:hypothetical protein
VVVIVFTTFMLIADTVALVHQHHESQQSALQPKEQSLAAGTQEIAPIAAQRNTSAVTPVGAHDNNNKPIRVRWQIEDAGSGRSAVLEPAQD